jgi:hypothetical protein
MKIKTGLVFVVILIFIVFAGCTNSRNDTAKESETLVLKSYVVPDRLAKEISQTINELLGNEWPRNKEQPAIGKARITPDGQLLVAAPKSFHDGVKSFIAQIKNVNPEPSASAEVNYWIIAGRKAKNPANLNEFREIIPALTTIQSKQGNMEFKLLDHLSTTLSQATESRFSDSFASIQQTVSAYSDGTLLIVLSIRCHDKSGSIDTQIETRNGELVVLGQLSQRVYGKPVFEPEEKGHELVNVYYIISAVLKK